MDKDGNSHPLLSNEAVARVFKRLAGCRVFKRLADRLQGVVSDTSTITITPEYAAHFLEVYVKKTDGAKFTSDRIRFSHAGSAVGCRWQCATSLLQRYIPTLYSI